MSIIFMDSDLGLKINKTFDYFNQPITKKLIAAFSYLLFIPIIYAKPYWDSGFGYYESLSSLCEGVSSSFGGNNELCGVSNITSGAPYGEFSGSCYIGLCDGIPLAYLYFTKEAFALPQPLNNNQPNMCAGNPIDPVTGNKMQKERLIKINSLQPLTFDLYYNSNRLEKWRHTYSRTLSASSYPNGPRIDFNGIPFGLSPIAESESPASFGGKNIDYGVQNTSPEASNIVTFSSAKQACETGWAINKQYYHFSWAPGSVGVLRQTPISTLGAIKQCYILDGPDGEVKMILDVYDVIAGSPAGYGDLPIFETAAGKYLRFTRENGSVVVFSSEILGMKNLSNTGETIEKINANGEVKYRFYTAENNIEEYSSVGKLLSITSDQGYLQSLSYDSVTGLLDSIVNNTGEGLYFTYEDYGDTNQYKRIKKIADHSNRVWTFNYDAVEFTLASIDLPDGTSRQYHYENPDDVQLLTGVTDETGQRYVTWSYDENKRATLSAHGNDQVNDRVELSYLTNGQRTVTKKRTSTLEGVLPLDIVSNFITHTGGDGPIVAEITGNNPVKFEHDAKTGYLEYSIEDPGASYQQRTEYSNYDTKGNPGIIREAVSKAAQRETAYTYDPRFHSKVATITEASVFPGDQKITTNQYDDFGNNTEVEIDGFAPDGSPVSRLTAFQYSGPYHQLTQIDGPRTDVSDIYTIDYYIDNETEGNNRARMKRVSAPLNITLYDNITYTDTGKIKTYIDANNVQTTLSYYYGNDRLQSLSQLDLNTAEKRLTEWTYLATGEINTITTGENAADKTTLTLTYDDARRLTGIIDGLGNIIEYILDSEGNVEQENIKDNSGALKKQLTQTFDDYNRLQLRTQVNEQFTETWLPNGTLDKTVDGKNVTTDYSYDNLRRLTQINQDMGGTSPQTANALTILNYDVQDNLTYVKNPVNGETIYTYDDLGNQLSRDSDDTGLTTYTHDDAGNIASILDANGETVNYTYDALNRLTSITTGNADDNYQYEYDNCKNGAGRLCKVSNAASTQHYSYDAFGNITSQQALQYAYDTADRLQTVSYPSGAIVHYDYDAAGQVSQVTLKRNGSMVPLASNVNYEAFGDISNLLYGNGLSLSQSRDSAYRPLTQSILAVFELNYAEYDENGNLKQRNDAIAGTNTIFGYDAHNRLNAATGDFGVRSYEYDKNANRKKLTEDSVDTSSTYDPASNRLSMRGVDNAGLDNNGNMLDLGGRGYNYTKHNRLFKVFDGGVLKATYQYNGLGQRISKTLPDGTGKYFIYDTDGKLMAETDINGNILFEYIYLNGQLLAKYTPDSDIDGISNYEEHQQGTNPVSPDSDGDGLRDLDEIFVYGTLMNNADSDGDGISDSNELAFNSDPLNGNINIGDVNQNGEFNLGDYVALMQFVLGTRTPNPTEELQADINHDGVLNVQDMLLMQRVLLGLQVSWSELIAESIEGLFAQIYQGIIPPAYAANGDGEIYYVHNDHLGTSIKMTSEIGLVVWQAVYDPFGKAAVVEDVDGDGKAVEMNVRFPGQYYDGESGLHYNYFRDYDPSIGRYITADPLGVIGRSNDPQLVLFGFQNSDWFVFEGDIYYDNQSAAPENLNHLYGYAGNNPLKNIDIYGLWYYGGGTGSFGDYISGPNGNVTPGFTQQDYVCSSVACVLNPFPSMVQRCIAHDKCYEKNRCNSSSWISNAFGGTKSCNQCNSNF